ncbi:MAG: hypothetical protein R3215_00050 [Halomonas sp.]|nr:hypothetical protein [Halomonas sp.]
MKTFIISIALIITAITSYEVKSSSKDYITHCNLDSPAALVITGCTIVIANSDSNKTRSKAYAYRALAFYSWEQYEKAIEDVSRALIEYPDNLIVYAVRGNIYSKIDDNGNLARSDINKAVSLSPDNAEVRLLCAEMFFIS